MKNKTEQNVIDKKTSMRKYIIAALCFVFFVIVALAAAIYSWEPKPDPASEMIIRIAAANHLAATNQLRSQARIVKEPDDLTIGDFVKIKQFEFLPINTEEYNSFLADIIRDVEITDIKFIKNFINLEYLNLTGTTYSEKAIPKWIRTLAKLGIYDHSEKYSIDISMLKNLPNLKALLIDGKNVKDIKSIAKIPNLEQLYIANIELIKNTKDLSRLTNLQFLGINNASEHEIIYLSKLINLKHISLGVAGPCSLEPLRKLKNLERLTLSGTGITDIEPLSDLNNLGELRLEETLVSNLEPLKELKKLKRLSIAGCKYITDEQVQNLQEALPETKISKTDH